MTTCIVERKEYLKDWRKRNKEKCKEASHKRHKKYKSQCTGKPDLIVIDKLAHLKSERLLKMNNKRIERRERTIRNIMKEVEE